MIYKSQIQLKNVSKNFEIIKIQKKIIVFGTGNFGLIVLNALNEINLNVIGFADNNRGNWGKK